jgi:hypothetical protein
MNNAQSFVENYASMPDDALQRLSLDAASLVPDARIALRMEMERRKFPVDEIDWEAQPVTEKSEPRDRAFSSFVRNIIVFVICDLAYLVLLGALISMVQGIDIEQFAENMTRALLSISVALALLTAKPFLIPRRYVPQKLKAVIILGLVAPPGGLLLITVTGLLHLGSIVGHMFWPAVIVWIVFGWWRDRKNKTQSIS